MRMFHEMRSEGTTQRAHQLPLFHANSPAVVPAKLEPIGALGFGRFGSSFFLLGAVTCQAEIQQVDAAKGLS